MRLLAQAHLPDHQNTQHTRLHTASHPQAKREAGGHLLHPSSYSSTHLSHVQMLNNPKPDEVDGLLPRALLVGAIHVQMLANPIQALTLSTFKCLTTLCITIKYCFFKHIISIIEYIINALHNWTSMYRKP